MSALPDSPNAGAKQSDPKRRCAVLEPAGRNLGQMQRWLIERWLGVDGVRQRAPGNPGRTGGVPLA